MIPPKEGKAINQTQEGKNMKNGIANKNPKNINPKRVEKLSLIKLNLINDLYLILRQG